MTPLHDAVQRHAAAHPHPDGIIPAPWPGMGMMRVHAPTPFSKSIYRPLVCLVLSGEKQVTAGPHTHVFAQGQSALVNADIPVLSRVTRATRAEPYLAVALELDPALLLDLAPAAPAPTSAPGPVLVHETGAAVADCMLRLVHLLDRPEAAAVLRAPITRELHYWLLSGPHGAALRTLVHPDGARPRIARAVALLREGYDRPIRVGHLAAAANMSPSTFHHHFRAVTSVSPLQFQKQLRLIEARRLLRAEGLQASRAAYAVGYESIPQFTREYTRMFGTPPARDARQHAA